LKFKCRIEKLEKSAKTIKNEQLTLHDKCGNRLQGNIIRLPNKNENGIAIIEDKEYIIAIDISISELLTLNLKSDQVQDLDRFKITPETIFLRRNNAIGGLEFKVSCMTQ
jgi:hypothetical protein